MSTIDQQREKIFDSIQTLPEDVLQELAGFIEYLRYKTHGSSTQDTVGNSLVDQAQNVLKPTAFLEEAPKINNDKSTETVSPYEAFKDSGFIGCGEGPSDLAANHKKYLEQGLKEKYGYR